MTEDDTPKRVEDEDKIPLAIPSHDPLPPPPEIHFTRPLLGQNTPAASSREDQGRAALGGWSNPSEAASHGAGLAAGATFVVSIIVSAMLGNWIDQRWNHTSMPWATLIMTLLGAAVGFINLKRLLDRDGRNRKQK